MLKPGQELERQAAPKGTSECKAALVDPHKGRKSESVMPVSYSTQPESLQQNTKTAELP